MLEDAAPPVLLTEERLRGRACRVAAAVVWLDARLQPIADGAATATSPAARGRDNLAYVIYTSGSTGRPKGVMIAPPRPGQLPGLVHAGLRGSTPATAVLPVDVALLRPRRSGRSCWPADRGPRVDLLDGTWAASNSARRCRIVARRRLVTTHAGALRSLGDQLEAGEAGGPDAGALRDRRRGAAARALSSALARPAAPAADQRVRPDRDDGRLCATACRATGPTRAASRSAGRSPTRGSTCWTAGCEPVPVGVAGELYIGGAGAGAGLPRPARA